MKIKKKFSQNSKNWQICVKNTNFWNLYKTEFKNFLCMKS